jgi:circadian clock protein KaiC
MTATVARSGLPGLDFLLDGGFPARRIYLVNGPTGSGKTTLGMQFAMEGVRSGEQTLYVTLAESPEELTQVAESHGWDIEGISLFTPQTAADDRFSQDQYTLFHPGEVELTGLISQIIRRIEQEQPARVVIDSLAEIRLLARDPLILLRQMRMLRLALVDTHCTVLLLDNRLTGDASSNSLQTFAHGIVELDQDRAYYGTARRCVSIVKLRGANPVTGRHDVALTRGGLTVFPRLTHAEPKGAVDCESLSSGSEELDRLCGGGLETGSSAMIIGPAGAGKSTVAAQYALAAAKRGEPSTLFLFDETERSCRLRWRSMNMPLEKYVEDGTVELVYVDPTTLSPGEFCHEVRKSVEHHGSRIVIIDSLSGYMQVMPEMRFMEVHLFELVKYLNARRVLSLLVVTQHGILGSSLESPIDVSYLIDTILLLRFFEARGEVHKAVSVVKKRLGTHERTIRECQLGEHGLRVGAPLEGFHGVLSGIPTYTGEKRQLL